jgi:3-methyladenine DNA glycosylase/8-oxoguanine DNA glycosylase
VRKAVSTFYADGRPLSIEEVRQMGERFVPYEGLSAQFLLAGARMAG